MTSITLQIPDEIALQLEARAAERHITVEQFAAQQLMALVPQGNAGSPRSYAAYFGIAKGQPGVFGSKEAIDRYVDEMRSEW